MISDIEYFYWVHHKGSTATESHEMRHSGNWAMSHSHRYKYCSLRCPQKWVNASEDDWTVTKSVEKEWRRTRGAQWAPSILGRSRSQRSIHACSSRMPLASDWIVCLYSRLSFLINNNIQQVEWNGSLVSPKIHSKQSHACNQHARTNETPNSIFTNYNFFFRSFLISCQFGAHEKNENTEECVLSKTKILLFWSQKSQNRRRQHSLYWE